MNFTILLIAVLGISSAWGIKAKIEDPKDKRDASGDYAPSAHSSHSYQAPALTQDESNAISIGAGYSVGGAKPSYAYASQGGESPYQLQSEGISGGHGYQLAPITLQPQQELQSSDLSELMNQLTHGINSGAISLPGGGHGITYQLEGQQGAQGGHGGQLAQFSQGGQYALPQFSFGSPKLAQYSLGGQASLPLYASTKGLGNFGSTGPVLFTPQSYSGQSGLSHGAPSGQAYESAAFSLGDRGHAYPGLSLNGGHSLGASYKALAGNYAAPGKSSFKPSTFIGTSSVPSDSSHGLSGHAVSYSGQSFPSFHSPAGGYGGLSFSSGGHGGSSFGHGHGGHGGPAKHVLAASEGLGSLESIASAFSHSGQIGSPPRTTYGIPSNAYSSGNGHAASAHAASSHAASAQAPQYYISSKYPSSTSFGSSSSYKAPAASHSSLNSYSAPSKYSFGGQSSHYSPKDAQGSYSETSYNTIKYSEELKPRVH